MVTVVVVEELVLIVIFVILVLVVAAIAAAEATVATTKAMVLSLKPAANPSNFEVLEASCSEFRNLPKRDFLRFSLY